jgi:hypothetical protein
MAGKTSKRHRVFVLGIGYAEDSMFSVLVLRHAKGFGKVEDALKDIGEAFLDAHRDEFELHGCCAKAKGNKFCPDCGLRIVCGEPVAGDVESWVRDFARTTVDESGDTWQCLNHCGWETGVGNKNPFTNGFVHVRECADSLIAAAVLPDDDDLDGFRTDKKEKIKIY